VAEKKEQNNTKDKKEDDIELNLNIEDLAKSALDKKHEKEEEVVKEEAKKEKIEKTIVTLRGRYEVFVYKEIKALSNPYVKAYEARDNQNKNRRFVCFVCANELPPRRRLLKTYQSVTHKCVPGLVAHGFLKWGAEKIEERYVLIFENVFGAQFMSHINTPIQAMTSDELASNIIKPMYELLTSYAEKGLVHGAIRPTNLFQNQLDQGKTFVINPCLALPLGYDEHVLFEPIELAMAEPDGKGMGHIQNDLYALGVTLAILMVGRNPVEGLSVNEIIEGKLRYGTFSLLLGQQRISGAINEVLRGLLVDNIHERWDLSDLQKWCDGSRQTPRQTSPEPKAERSFEFMKKHYTSLRLLARDLAKNPSEAFKVIKDESLHKWLGRTLTDLSIADRYRMATAHLATDGDDSDGMMAIVSRVVMALDPVGPIRYKEHSFMPDSMGQMISTLARKKGGAEMFASILSEELVPFWFTLSSEGSSEQNDILKSLKRCQEYLRKRAFGNGMERCLYFLNRDVQCLSPLFDKFYVYNAIGVIVGLELVAKRDDRPEEPFDNHIAAYLTVHFSGSNEGDIQLLGSTDLNIRYHSTLTLFASIQNFSEMSNLSNLAGWMMTLMDPVIEAFHSRQLRDAIKKDLEKISRQGDLVAMLRHISNTNLMKEDVLGFSKAQLTFMKLEKEKKVLNMKIQHPEMGVSEGRQVSALISFILATVSFIVFMTMIY